MGDDMRNIVKKIAFFQEELKKMPPKKEIQKTDRKEFTLLLSGISACRKIPGILRHMGYQCLYHCEREADIRQARSHLRELYGICDRESLQAALLKTFSDSERYRYYMTFWAGAPLFDLEKLGKKLKELFLRQMEMARHFYPILREKGFYAWDINEKVGLCRKAVACGLISEEDFWDMTDPWVRQAQVFYHSWQEYAISCLCGAVFFMRREEKGLEKFLDLNLNLVRQLFERDGAWESHAWYEPKEREWAELLEMDVQQTCLATNRVLEEGKVGYIYREQPADDFSDCGWRILAGDEPEDYLADGQHIELCSFNQICNLDPSIMAYFNAGYGKAYEKTEAGWTEAAS